MKWFGHPWPSAELRAPVCEDDGERVEVPVGGACLLCPRVIAPEDQGVLLGLAEPTGVLGAGPVHLSCLLTTMLGPSEPVAPILEGFTCPRCGRTSANPNDRREGWCGACHDWTGSPS